MSLAIRNTFPIFERAGHTHDELEYMLVLQGFATYTIDTHHYRLRANDMLWCFPEQFHHLTSCSEDIVIWCAQFDQDRIRTLCAQGADPSLLLRHPNTVHCCNLSAAATSSLVQLLTNVSRSDAIELNFLHGIDFLLLSSWTHYQQAESDVNQINNLHPAVHKAIFLLHQTNAPRDLNHLAQEVGISASLLSRLFNQQIGISLSQYRNRIRIEKFIQLSQRKTTYNYLALALEAGFGSYAQFQRAFKDYMGIGPGEWKKNQALGVQSFSNEKPSIEIKE